MMYININIITIILIISLSIYLLYFQKFKNIQEPFNDKKDNKKSKVKMIQCNRGLIII